MGTPLQGRHYTRPAPSVYVDAGYLYGGHRAGEGGQGPDDVESGQGCGGGEGAGQQHKVPLDDLHAGVTDAHLHRRWSPETPG